MTNPIMKAGTSFSQVAQRGVPNALDGAIRDGQQALTAAGLNYEIMSKPLSDLTDAPFAGRWNAAVRSSDGALIGVNSSRFHHHQPSDLAALGDAIINVRDDAYYSAGGQSHDGRTQFLVVTLNGDPIDGPDGGTFQSVMLVNGTNGNCRLKGIAFTMRLACMNQFPAIFRNGAHLFDLGHSWSARQALPTAVSALQTATRVFDEMDLAIHRLLDTPLDNPLGMVSEIAGKRPTDDGRALTEWEKRFNAITAEYHADHNAHAQGSMWGMIMAAQGVDEHGSRVKHGNRDLQRNMRVIRDHYPLMDRALTLAGV